MYSLWIATETYPAKIYVSAFVLRENDSLNHAWMVFYDVASWVLIYQPRDKVSEP